MRFSCVSGLTDGLTVSNIQYVCTHSQFNDTYVTRLLLLEITLAMMTALCYRFGYSLEPSAEIVLTASMALQRPAWLRSTVRCSPSRSQVSLVTSRGDRSARHYSYVDQFHPSDDRGCPGTASCRPDHRSRPSQSSPPSFECLRRECIARTA